jgi:hypothetical protein
MGVAGKDEMCAQVVTPGYIVILEAKGQQFVYHSNQDGRMLRAVNTPVVNFAGDIGLTVRKVAAQDLKVSLNEVQLIDLEEVEWPDSCLGIREQGTMCMMVVTPGYRVVVEAKGQQVEYHTDREGGRILKFSGR